MYSNKRTITFKKIISSAKYKINLKNSSKKQLRFIIQRLNILNLIFNPKKTNNEFKKLMQQNI